MQVIVRWGNLAELSQEKRVSQIIQKNVQKIYKLLKKFDSPSVKLSLSFELDQRKKRYKATLYLITPKSSHHIREDGFTFEEAISQAMSGLKRKFRKNQEKKMTLSRGR